MTAAKRVLTKEQRIKKEYNRLAKEFKALAPSARKIAEELISNAAFMAITLQDLQAQINEVGTVERYQNGENQWGQKVNPDVATYNTTLKNYASVIKQLNDLLPKMPTKDEDEDFKGFLSER